MIGWRWLRLKTARRRLLRGLAAYERQHYPVAFRFFTASASAGNANAQYQLGRMFARGHGVISNAPDAVTWFRRAAEQGHAASQFELSLAYARGHSPERLSEFRNWYRIAADHDSNSAEQTASLLFPNGLAVAKDPAEAFRWSLAAAQQGLAESQA